MTITHRQEIIKAAESRFIRTGYRKTTLEEIAKDIRIAKATIYHYFDSKTSLYIAVLKNQVDEYVADMQDILNITEINATGKLALFLKKKIYLASKFILLGDVFWRFIANDISNEEETVIRYLNEKENDVLLHFVGDLNISGFDEKKYTIRVMMDAFRVMLPVFPRFLQIIHNPQTDGESVGKLVDIFSAELAELIITKLTNSG